MLWLVWTELARETVVQVSDLQCLALIDESSHFLNCPTAAQIQSTKYGNTLIKLSDLSRNTECKVILFHLSTARCSRLSLLSLSSSSFLACKEMSTTVPNKLQRKCQQHFQTNCKEMSTTFTNKLQRKCQQNYQTNCDTNVTSLTNFYAMSTTQSNLNANVNNINNFLWPTLKKK